MKIVDFDETRGKTELCNHFVSIVAIITYVQIIVPHYFQSVREHSKSKLYVKKLCST